MAESRPTFRRERAAPGGNRGLPILLALFFAVGLALALRPVWEPRLDAGVLVEVTGEVPKPGTYLVRDGNIASAVEAAGGAGDGLVGTVQSGDRLRVTAEGVQILPPSDPLLVALPVDLNEADLPALVAIPGLSAEQAEAVLRARELGGRFETLDEVARRAEGIGTYTLERIAPFVVPAPRSGPVDLNRATAAELESLPGIGPVTAARIVVEREDHGPFVDIEDLQRVRGVGPATVSRLADRITVGEPE